MNRKPAIGIGIAVAIAALGLAAWASDSARTEKPAAVDAQEYADFMAHEALDVQDLAEGAELQRRMFNRMTPPGLAWVQPAFPFTVPFDAANFGDEFLDELLGEDRNSVAVYPLTLALDPKTRETWIYNAEGKPIAALPSEKTSRAWPEGSDPARVVLRLDLLPSEDVEPYLYVEDRIAETLAAVIENAAKSARKEAIDKSSLSGGQFGFADARKLTNGNFRLTVTNGTAAAEIFSYTIWHTSATVVSTWTNEEDEVVVDTNIVWTPVSPPYAGLEGTWEVETTNLLLTNGAGIWEDASATGSARVRFYGATQRADSDEDGLTDGAEIFLHRTDPSLSDTDGDGMSDGWETLNGLNARSGLDASLVGWWKLDDGAGSNAVNSAQDAYHGELVGFSGTNGYWTEDGFLGGALRFDGIDDWVRIAQDPAMLTGGPFTLSAQVWLDPDCTSAWPEAVSDYEAGTWNGYCLGFNENRAYAMMGPYGWLMDSNALAGRWVWTALEYDGAQMRLYLDGVLAGATSAAFVPATNGFFALGNGQDDSYGSEFWKGRIDDVRLYRTALGTNGLAGMYDAQEDPDGDGLSNLEECRIGSDIHGSNEVVFVYFVDSTNRTPDGRRSSGGETAQFATWDALQAKAASTVRFKEGFAEFTNSTLPPSDPPKWYLGIINYSEGLGTVTDIDDDYSRIISYDYWGYCRKEYSPSGWPDTITNHICEGYGHTIEDWTGEYCFGYTTWDYSFSQPDENVVEVQCGHEDCTYGTSDYCTNLYHSSCVLAWMGGGYAYPFEMWEEYISNSDWSYSVEDNGSYEIIGSILTNEYTDALLLSCAASDLDGMADWEGLGWGQRWARDEHRQTPYAETLPTNELCSIHLMATNRASLQLQKLRYRWSLPSVSGVVYRIFWWEKFIPANGGGTSVVQRTADVLGTGGTVYTPAFDLPPPSAEGCTYPVPMESVLKVDFGRLWDSHQEANRTTRAIDPTLRTTMAYEDNTRADHDLAHNSPMLVLGGWCNNLTAADVNLKCQFEPASAGEHVLWKVDANVGSVDGDNTGNFASGDTVSLRLLPSTSTMENHSGKDFVVKLGIDQDGDSVLSDTEAFPLEWGIRVIGKPEYDYCRSSFPAWQITLGWLLYPDTMDFIDIFLDTDSVASYQADDPDTIAFTGSYNMKNGLGCDPTSLTQGSLRRYTWQKPAGLRKRILLSDDIWDMAIEPTIAAMDIGGWYADPANASSNSNVFTGTFNDNVSFAEQNLGNAPGTASVNMMVTVHTERATPKPKITHMQVTGTVTDLYDFGTHTSDEPNGYASRIQVCYAPSCGRTAGKIFNVLVNCDVTQFPLITPAEYDDFTEINGEWTYWIVSGY